MSSVLNTKVLILWTWPLCIEWVTVPTQGISHFCGLLPIKVFSIKYQHAFWYTDQLHRIFTHDCNRKTQIQTSVQLTSFLLIWASLILHLLSSIFPLMVAFVTLIFILGVLRETVKRASALGKLSPHHSLLNIVQTCSLPYWTSVNNI